jgi:hypothetical protein
MSKYSKSDRGVLEEKVNVRLLRKCRLNIYGAWMT